MSGFFNVIIGLISRKMCKDETTRRVIFFDVKGKYYPIAFTFMITFLGGLRLDYIINLLIGYLIGLEKIKDYVGDFINVERICKTIENERGYISIGNVGEELPAFQIQDNTQTRAGGINTINSSKTTGGGGGFKAPGKIEKPKFPGGGRTLGTNDGDRNRNN